MATKTLNSSSSSSSSGFSLMEIIIAVGVLMVISSVGVITIRGFDDRTKEVKAQNAAKEVYNAARAKVEDNDSNTKPQDAATEYNSSQSNSASNKKITVKVLPTNATSSNLYVEAYYGARIRAVYDPQNTQNGNSNPGGSGSPVIPTIKDTVSQLTYQCDTTTTGYLPVFNVSDSTTVSLVGSDGSEKLVNYEEPDLTKVRSNYMTAINFVEDTGFNNISEEITMKAGVTYTVKVYGTFTNLSVINGTDSSPSVHGTQLSFRDCLVSVDKLGKDTGLTNINWVGGKKYTKTTDSIPSTVTDLDCAFAEAINFNDPNAAKWNVKNVKTLFLTFYKAKVFDQSVNNWDTRNVENMYGVFHTAQKFNNGGQPLRWNTSSVVNMHYMFASSSAFNQNIGEYYDSTTGVTYWDTSNVKYMISMFNGATKFNQNISNWDVSNVAAAYRVNFNTGTPMASNAAFQPKWA